MAGSRIFLLSPANCGGKRAAMLLREAAQFELAVRLRAGTATLGEAFSFMSGLYFRGKLAYSQAFARPPGGIAGAYVITSNQGLVPPETVISSEGLRGFGTVGIDCADDRYRSPLERDARQIHGAIDGECEIVLLGSIATGKYVEILQDVFGARLCFPRDFIGRGDMSRGGLMLRCARGGSELEYIPVAGSTRRGKRPARLGAPE